MYELGTEIRVARVRAKLTQAELAKRLYVDQSVISDYERGVTIPDWDTLQGISRATGIELGGN
jgi:transcriptional regulator with XRE-family HTH domain